MRLTVDEVRHSPTVRRFEGAAKVAKAWVRAWSAGTLFVAGWSLLWAHGLHLIGFVPDWLALSAILIGLALIPHTMVRHKMKPDVSA